MGKFVDNIIRFVKKNDTNILTGIGIADGLLLGGYLWYRTGQKVQKVIVDKQAKENRKLTFKEKFKTTWKMFILPITNTIVSGGMLIYSTRISNKKLAALGAAYNLTEVAFQKFIDKTKEELGDKKVNDISQEVSKDAFKNQDGTNSIVMMSSDGNVTFYEPLTDRYFQSTWTKIQKAANELNSQALTGWEGKITLSEWFYKLGLPKTDISDEMGWEPQINGKNGIIDISLDAILNSDNIPCGAIRYNTRPKYFE